MAPKRRIQVELLALAFAAAVTAVSSTGAEYTSKRLNSEHLTAIEALAESALYLDALPERARLHRGAGRWQVTDGQATVWLDARTGELLEMDFAPTR
jgi:hypothetical protein